MFKSAVSGTSFTPCKFKRKETYKCKWNINFSNKNADEYEEICYLPFISCISGYIYTTTFKILKQTIHPHELFGSESVVIFVSCL